MSPKPVTRLFTGLLILLLVVGCALSFMNREYIDNLFKKKQTHSDTTHLQVNTEHVLVATPVDTARKNPDTTTVLKKNSAIADSLHKAVVTRKEKTDIKANAALEASATKIIEAHTSTSPANKFADILSISPDKATVAKRVTTDIGPSLMFYPAGAWNETFVILPASASAQHKLVELLYRDYSGVVYPSRKKVQLMVNGARQNVELIRLKGPQPSEGYPEYVALTTNPQFVIFGDYWNSGRWYIYQNNRITTFAADGLSSLDSLK
jgi:hypothetical protein